jgi:hypothetical protein
VRHVTSASSVAGANAAKTGALAVAPRLL